MRTDFDFSPYYRDTIGFDRIFDLLDAVASQAGPSAYPPYDIEKLGDDAYRIVMAVAGFDEDDLDIIQKENQLVVSGRAGPGSEAREYLYRGIAGRNFERRFQLADHVVVDAADLADGLLSIALRRELPESLKPRRIEITSTKAPDTAIEGQVAA